jgi:hypothetical protein
MRQLKACVWVEFFSGGEGDQNSRRIQAVLRNFVKQETDGEVQVESQGMWVFFSTVSLAIDFSQSLFDNLEIAVQFRTLIAIGEVDFDGQRWSGWVLERYKGLIQRLEVDQIWFTESVFHAVNIDEYAWEDIGLVNVEGTGVHCFRLLRAGQCFVPPVLKRAISEQKVVVFQKGEDLAPVRKSIHVVFVGYNYDEDLHTEVARISSIVPNDRLWLVLPKLNSSDRSQWQDFNRQLISGSSAVFLNDIVRSDLTLIGGEINATMFLDPVSLASGELALCGVALPKVPMARIIDGYTLDLLSDGEWGHGEVDSIQCRLTISLDGETITVFHDGCKLNSHDMEVGKPYSLGSGARLLINRLTYRYIANVGKPYQGLILGESTKRVAISVGERIELGRQPAGGGFTLPDRGGVERIQWSNTPHAQNAKHNQLTLDRALTGRHHVALTILSVGKYSIAPMHDKLPTFILPPAADHIKRINGEQVLRNEGLLVVGTNVLRIGKTQ